MLARHCSRFAVYTRSFTRQLLRPTYSLWFSIVFEKLSTACLWSLIVLCFCISSRAKSSANYKVMIAYTILSSSHATDDCARRITMVDECRTVAWKWRHRGVSRDLADKTEVASDEVWRHTDVHPRHDICMQLPRSRWSYSAPINDR